MSHRAGDVGADDIRRVETQLGALLRRTRAFIAESATDVHPELGSTGYAVLARVTDGGPTRATDLVERFDTDKATISRQTAHLEAIGLVSRAPDPSDGRAQIITVTDEGRRRVDAARRRNRQRLRRGLGEWDADEVRELGRLLEKFNGLELH
ncbi:MAG TPA: MarR family winged helix-turn-helix transcriptional regulator [Actinomycetales bacterium]|nr:MarR family winged helix-turn-helix transcriptional regulator [Actinomycetales bacterium]